MPLTVKWYVFSCWLKVCRSWLYFAPHAQSYTTLSSYQVLKRDDGSLWLYRFGLKAHLDIQVSNQAPSRHPVGILVRWITRIQKSLHLVMMKASVRLCDARRYIVRANLPLEGSPKQNCFWVRGSDKSYSENPYKGKNKGSVNPSQGRVALVPPYNQKE